MSSTRRSAPCFAITVILLALVAAPAWPCSMTVSSAQSALTSDGSYVFIPDARAEEIRIIHYDPVADSVSFVDVDLGVHDASVRIQDRGPDGTTWIRIHCSRPDAALCNQIVAISPEGEIVHKRPSLEVGVERFDRGQRKLVPTFDPALNDFVLHEGQFEAGHLVITHQIGAAQPVLRRVALPKDLSWDSRGVRTRWAESENGKIAISHELNGRLTLLWYDQDGKERTRVDSPAVHLGAPASAEEPPRLGSLGRLLLADDGTLFATQGGADGDTCKVYQPSSLAIFDRKGAIKTFHRGGYSARLVNNQLVAISGGAYHRFSLDGTLLDRRPYIRVVPENPLEERFAEDPERVHTVTREDGRETWLAAMKWSDEETFDKLNDWLRTWMAALGPDDDPQSWSYALGRVSDDTKREQLARWMIDTDWSVTDQVFNSLWTEYSAAVCARHPEHAPAKMLDLFRTLKSTQRGYLFRKLAACFSKPVPEVYDAALAVERDLQTENSQHSEDDLFAVFSAWGASDAWIAGRWKTNEFDELAEFFDQVADEFDRRLRDPKDDQRDQLRTALLSIWPVESEGYSDFDRMTPHRSRHVARLVDSAARWSTDPDPFVAATGRQVLEHHGAGEPAPLTQPAQTD